MPKVSQEYRDARRQQILDAATRCFVRNGFQATSMQDLFAESQLSSGSFYLYFESKDDLIIALAEENASIVVSLLHDLASSGRRVGLGEALAVVLETVAQQDAENQICEMAVLVWAEALRSPQLHARFSEVIGRLSGEVAEVIARHQREGALAPGVSADAVARLVLSIVPGSILQMALFGPAAIAGFPEAARGLWPTDGVGDR